MKIKLFALLFALSIGASATAHIPISPTLSQKILTNTAKPKIQVALLLDTSNSMDGLIDQAKSQLWKMVNELATSKREGQSPDIEIALYQYGNDHLPQAEGYIHQVTGLTTDLDLVSEKLFELTTNGGTEMCGWSIKDATTALNWSNSNNDLKIIFIAGNEPFNQGPVDFQKSCKDAISKGIIINTIYCGEYKKGVRELWKQGSELADGQYMNIDQKNKVVHVPTPFDDEINQLNSELNKTYIGYGQEGKLKQERQMAQDNNAAAYGGANARTRASFKAKKSYNNQSWDLVDAAEADEEVVEKLEEEALPEEMKKMDKKERLDFINKKGAERKAIQEKIRILDTKAKKFIAEKQQTDANTLTLDKVMINTVRQQAIAKKYRFE